MTRASDPYEDLVSLVLTFAEGFARDRGVSGEEILGWVKNPDWQDLLRDVQKSGVVVTRIEWGIVRSLRPEILERLRELVQVEGKPLASARRINITDAPPSRPEFAQFETLIAKYLDEAREERFISDRTPTRFPAGKTLLALKATERTLAVRAVIERLQFINGKLPRCGPTIISSNSGTFEVTFPLSTLLNRLLRVALPLTEDDLVNLLQLHPTIRGLDSVSLPVLLGAIEHFAENCTLPQSVISALAKIEYQFLDPKYMTNPDGQAKQVSRVADRIACLLGRIPPARVIVPADAPEQPFNLRASWDGLVQNFAGATGSKPTKKWLATVRTLVEAYGHKQFRSALGYHASNYKLIDSRDSQQFLKGLVWAASVVPNRAVCAALGDLGETCFQKIPNFGPRCKLVGNAVLWSLSAMSTPDAIAQLTRISSKLKHASARAMADKAFNRISDTTGMTRADLEEIAVPKFDLSPDSDFSQTTDDFTLTVSITTNGNATLAITDATGKSRKSIPASLKSHPTLRALQRKRKNIISALAIQTRRVEHLFMLPERSWSYADWRSHYLDHPLMSSITRRLIWRFNINGIQNAAIPMGDRFLSAADIPLVSGDLAASRVSLLHPSREQVDSVHAWRSFLERRQITQPFKQAHREIYLLTDAERQTDTYSNRFAAHIIRQHQFAALCAQRGWKYHLMGAWDSHNVPTLELPAHKLKTEFWVEQIDDGPDMNVNQMGISNVLSTDQVRFCHFDPPARKRNDPVSMLERGQNQPASLVEIPPQLFSEVMRDVDLFVGVCSVGNDPNWQDGGTRQGDYWQSYSFGDLNVSAHTRKDVLQNLIPRLAIAAQCSFSDRFLLVQGTHRKYKIHLGSGNILMEPNDQYLCIVPDRSPRTDANMFLPFEGDNTLSVILSKAFLLAQDHKIKDPTILRQIKPCD